MGNLAVIVNKDSITAFSMFKRRLSSVMSFVMSRHFLFVISAIVLVALAACGKGEDEQSAVPATPEQTTAAPASEQEGPDLIKALQDNSGVMTPEEQKAAIERARVNAEAAENQWARMPSRYRLRVRRPSLPRNDHLKRVRPRNNHYDEANILLNYCFFEFCSGLLFPAITELYRNDSCRSGSASVNLSPL